MKKVNLSIARDILKKQGFEIDIEWEELMQERWKNLEEDVSIYLENFEDFSKKQIQRFVKIHFKELKRRFINKVNNDDNVCDAINEVLGCIINEYLD